MTIRIRKLNRTQMNNHSKVYDTLSDCASGLEQLIAEIEDLKKRVEKLEKKKEVDKTEKV
jgi:hypothetical protein